MRKVFALFYLVFGLYSQSVFAMPEFWQETAYAIECKETPVDKVLKDFAINFGVELVVTGKLQGGCEGWRRSDDAVSFLNYITNEFRLQWFYYKGKLYVSPTSDFKTRRIESVAGFKSAVQGLGLYQEKFGWGEFEDNGVVIVSGPSRYVSLVSALNRGEKKIKERAENTDIYVFPLKYASVADRQVKIREENIVIPGVATILQSLLGEKESVVREEETSEGDDEIVVKEKKAKKLSEKFKQKDRVQVYVEGDVRTNSIIIRAKEKDYEFYKRLIDDLDRPGNLIEIDAVIVDISREKLSDIGVNFNYQNDNRRAAFQTSVNGLSRNPVQNGATILIENFDSFYANLRLLETKGDASIIANTSILTMENQPALIDLSETVYIQTIGERIANVQPVTAGTLLSVTPRSIDDEKIKLVIDIEDGRLISANGDNATPAVRKTTISTKALVDQNRSLVIGGYHIQSYNREHRGIPLLKDIPLLGGIFSSKVERSRNAERLFILTPRLSKHHHGNPEDYSTTGSGALISEALETIDQRWQDANRSYLEKAKDLLSTLAQKKVPHGYQLSTIKKDEKLGFFCKQAGIEYYFEGGQKIVGKGMVSYVGIAVNRSESTVDLGEYHCAGNGLIAVALFPESSLSIGEATEVFVAMESSRMQINERKTLLSENNEETN